MDAQTIGEERSGRRVRRRALGVVTAAAALLAPIGTAQAEPPTAPPTPPATSASSSGRPDSAGQLETVVRQIGADVLWNQGITGAGVNVAIIDTGIAPVPALSDADKVVAVVDLSTEADDDGMRFLDSYGHGTHMAGIIAGRDATTGFRGVAPDAGIVSVKVADNTGATDVATVIAGVDWVVDHADDLDIGVLNMSYDSGSVLGYRSDPLARAVERAWQAGIVVVAAVGNDGRSERQVAMPAADPYVIAVAAAESKHNGSFTVPNWATSGDGTRDPDVAAPGVSIESLRVPGSRVDVEHPEGIVDDALVRGSGSSQAAAVVSGGAALLLQARPDLTPDQVKALLRSSTSPLTPRDERFGGSGLIQLAALVQAPVGDAVQHWPVSDGTGSLRDAGGGVVSGHATDVIDQDWVGARWSEGTWDGARWSGGEWTGVRWSGASWSGAHWSGASWSGASWSGASWSGASWSGASWSGASWSGASWSGASWSGASWSGASWSGASWSGASWS